MSRGLTALSNANNCNRSLGACLAWIPALEPVLKNFSSPRWRKLAIISYSVTLRDTDVKVHSSSIKRHHQHKEHVQEGGINRPLAAPLARNLSSSIQALKLPNRC